MALAWGQSWRKACGLSLVILYLVAALSPPVQAQDGGIYVLNQEALFSQSAFGQRVVVEIDSRTQTIMSENQQLASDLEAEELALTDQRADLPVDEFRALADAFDKKVEEIRTAQAGKNVELNQWAEDEQKRFFALASPIIVKLAEELGAVAVIDNRSVIISADHINLTARAIERVNQEIGDGSPKTEP